MSEPDRSGWTTEDWLIQRYKYLPSTPAAATLSVAFGLSTLLHLFQLIKWRTWYFIPFLMGGLCVFPPLVGIQKLFTEVGLLTATAHSRDWWLHHPSY